jgi:hypothetical protein
MLPPRRRTLPSASTWCDTRNRTQIARRISTASWMLRSRRWGRHRRNCWVGISPHGWIIRHRSLRADFNERWRLPMRLRLRWAPRARWTDAGWREVELLRGVTDLEDAGATERWQAEGFSFVETGLWDAWSRAEPSEDLRARVVHAAKQSVRVGAGRPVVVCTHGGTINALLAELLGVARDYWIPLARASISEVARCEGAGVVRSINDASYLPTSLRSF